MKKQSRERAIALVSGGLDSFCLVRTLLQKGVAVTPVYVCSGLVWEAAELHALRRWLESLKHPRLGFLKVLPVSLGAVYGNHWSVTGKGVPSNKSADRAVYLPGRNVFLLSVAAIHGAGQDISTVAFGSLASNPFGDATPAFLTKFADCLSQAVSHPVQIQTPLRRWTKAQLVAAAQREPLHLTFSCLHPNGERHCGRCNKCAERKQAFRAARIPDSTSYA